MWQDGQGYYTVEPLEDSKEVLEDLEDDEFYKVNGNKGLFVNGGGTIVSGFNGQEVGVSPYKNLLKKVPWLKDTTFDYHPGIKKLSQQFTFEDYMEVEKLVHGCSKTYLVITHGTDYVATFSVWCDLLAKKYQKKILVLVSQRSLDKPTSDLKRLVLTSFEVFKKLKEFAALVFCTDGLDFLIHSPYEIRKFDTFKKDCFFSEGALRFRSQVPRVKLVKVPLASIDPNWVQKTSNICFETFFEKPSHRLVVGSGIGNSRQEDENKRVFSRCLSGPLNSKIYQKKFKEKKEDPLNCITSWESFLAYSTFTST